MTLPVFRSVRCRRIFTAWTTWGKSRPSPVTVRAAGGHLLPRQGLDGRVKGRLVALDHHQIVRLLHLHQPFRVFALGVEGVGGDHGAGQVERCERGGEAGDLVGLARYSEL
ncbi:hypothetical protein, partial [Streptomyces sp. H27-G5]|uniref:hypothetical protein n=1 Tax=Streptomyces sp. H27-G5 TaxID=2996698 RepID=UPI002D1E3D86